MLRAVSLLSPPRMGFHHPCIAGVVCANSSQLLFLPLPLFPPCESTGAYDGRSPPRLLSQLQGLRLPALLQRAAKSSLPAAHHKPSACLSPSLPFPSLILPRNPDLSPDRVGGQDSPATSRGICWSMKSSVAHVLDVTYQCCQKVK